MAEQLQVDEVRNNLPKEAEAEGWDDVKISAMLDGGMSVTRIVANWWRYRATQTANFVDVSESGSSRSLSTIHKNAVELRDYWDKKLADEENPPIVETVGRIAFHRIKRV